MWELDNIRKELCCSAVAAVLGWMSGTRKQSTLTVCRQTAPLVRHLAALAGRPLASALRFDSNPVVDRSADSLFATKVALRSLNRNVAEEQLNLFQFSACRVT